ncbi:hypothetical protein FACS1894102_0630 [Spirochaetia bacterium]|nr:hypothetical protein FACS1894102_0630 [Spirochaetia bacterium]
MNIVKRIFSFDLSRRVAHFLSLCTLTCAIITLFGCTEPQDAKIYTVTLNANGGSVTPGGIAVREGSAVGKLPTPIKAGHVFNGWNTEKSGMGASFMKTAPVNSNITVYAKWIEALQKSITVTGIPAGKTGAVAGALTPAKVANVEDVSMIGENMASGIIESANLTMTLQNWSGSGSCYVFLIFTGDSTMYTTTTSSIVTTESANIPFSEFEAVTIELIEEEGEGGEGE